MYKNSQIIRKKYPKRKNDSKIFILSEYIQIKKEREKDRRNHIFSEVV